MRDRSNWSNISISGLFDDIDALEAELDSALEIIASRVYGEKDLLSAKVWLESNFPKFCERRKQAMTKDNGTAVPGTGSFHKDSGGPAFPRPISTDERNVACNVAWEQEGMSLRDWFAGQALAGICANPAHVTEAQGAAALVAKAAFFIADAMLAEREKGAKE